MTSCCFQCYGQIHTSTSKIILRIFVLTVLLMVGVVHYRYEVESVVQFLTVRR